ncbi:MULTISPECIES: alpha-L-fucosidase [unclassified Microbacterium]|uniref:alpha-L-fucosidase n=1 Tax=unclassified Microbacterium TaxID=2609290 RepID=UPI0015E3EA38|nr:MULTISPECIES: alpha-L-fucosidase [unclassified Microbacterium]
MSLTPASWFPGAALGIFIHFGHAARRGWELSWQLTGGVEGQFPAREPVPTEEYFANAALFDPQGFDAAEWADAIAATGATYAVFTTKHHDGFAMFDTALSDYSITRTSPFGRDITRELVDALRARGIRIGFYFSFPDWHHEDYPRMTDATTTKPYRIGSYVRTSPAQWARFHAFMRGQITELLTNYGDVAVLWFDGEFEHTAEEWDFAGIREHVRSLQPDCLVNDRCLGQGDFLTPEQQLPDAAPAQPWEVCLTMNESWGWTTDDERWKSTATILDRFIHTIAAGGNLLLNVGPKGDGTFPAEASERLTELGAWVSRNREAVYGLTAAPDRISGPVPLAARTADDGIRLFAYCTLRPWDRLVLRGVPVRRVRGVRVLGTDSALEYEAVPSLPDVHAGSTDPRGDLEITVPRDVADSLMPVIEVHLAPLA